MHGDKRPSRTAKAAFERFDRNMRSLRREYNGKGGAGKATRPAEERRRNTAGEANNGFDPKGRGR